MEVLNGIVMKNKIRTVDEVVLFSKKQSMEGKGSIQWWLLTHTNRKQWQDFLDTAWLIEDAEMNASQARKSCIEVLREALSSECNVHPKTHALCAKRWFPAALEVLSKNNIDPISFTRQVVNTLTKGRGKGSNLFTVDQQTVPNHSYSCHWASRLTASSVHQTLSLILSQLLIKTSFSSTICGMVLMARGMTDLCHGINSWTCLRELLSMWQCPRMYIFQTENELLCNPYLQLQINALFG